MNRTKEAKSLVIARRLLSPINANEGEILEVARKLIKRYRKNNLYLKGIYFMSINYNIRKD